MTPCYRYHAMFRPSIIFRTINFFLIVLKMVKIDSSFLFKIPFLVLLMFMTPFSLLALSSLQMVPDSV